MLRFKDIKDIYLIGEIGINHNGDLQLAKRLVDAVFACGWNCAKFQKRDPDVCVPEKQKPVAKDTPWGRMTYLDYRKRVELDVTAYDYIDKYCREKPLDWTASVWDLNSLKFISRYRVPFLKIPSAKTTDLELVNAVAGKGVPVLASTGMSTLKDIDNMVDIFRKRSTEFALMHVNSSYPTPIDEININCIRTLKSRYDCVVGYSGHEYHVEPTVYACVLGVKIIERHITISHDLWGTDHKASLEVAAMDLLKKRVKDIEIIMGHGRKEVTPSERKIMAKLKGTSNTKATGRRAR